MSLVVHGVRTCQTCRKALKWLEAREVPHTWVDLRESPPAREAVERWVAAFGAKALRNTSGGSYRALGPEKNDWTEAQWTNAFAADPMLIKRPVIERDGEPLLVGFRGSDEALAEALGLR